MTAALGSLGNFGRKSRRSRNLVFGLPRPPDRSAHRVQESRDILAAELWLREPLDPTRLNGCGMLVINPPYRFEDEIRPVMAALLARLATGEPGAGTALVRLAGE